MRRHFLPILLLVLLVASVFYQVHSFDYIRFDDDRLIMDNPHVKNGLTSGNLLWALDMGATENWHPLTWFSLQLDSQLFGHSPGTYHLSNVFYHTLNTILLFIWLSQMTGKVFRSFIVAALFGIHPLHVESVAWMSERKDTLSVLFGFITLIFYTKYTQSGSGKWYRLSIIAFVGSLLSKQMLVTMPFLLLLLDYWPYKRFKTEGSTKNKKLSSSKQKQKTTAATASLVNPSGPLSFFQLVKEKIPFLVLSILFSAITFIVQKSGGAVHSFEKFSLLSRVLNAISVYGLYLKKMFWPNDLSFFYPHPKFNYQVEYIFLGLVLLVGLTGYAWSRRDQIPCLFTGWFWYLGTLVPVIGLIQIGTQQMADRYTYFPIIGIFIALVWIIGDFVESHDFLKKLAATLSVSMILLLSYVAHQQVRYWENSFTLFYHALELDPSNTIALNNLGTEYLAKDDPRKALEMFNKAVEIDPSNASALTNLGLLFSRFGQAQKSVEYSNLALHHDPRNAQAHNNLANILRAAGKTDEAIYHYQEALKINPDYPESLSNYANILQMNGELDKSEEFLRKAIEINPLYSSAYNNLGNTLQKKKQFEESIQLYLRAIELNPKMLNFRFNLAKSYEKIKQHESAISILKECMKIEPKNKQVPLMLAGLYLRIEKWDAASDLLREIEENEGPSPSIQMMKSRIAAKKQNWKEATEILDQLIKENPTAFELHNELGEVLLQKGDREKAKAAFNQALKISPNFEKAKSNLESIE